MLVLALDTSTPAVTVGLVELAELPDDGWAMPRQQGGSVIAERQIVANNRHGELLAPLIAQVLAESSVGGVDLTAICAGLGPGPFTGLRVGIVTAASMADALGIPVYGVCSLDAYSDTNSVPHAVVADARRKQVYWATYTDTGERVEGPDIAAPSDVVSRLRSADVTCVMGAGADLYAESFEGFAVMEDSPYPDVAVLARRAHRQVNSQAPSEDLTPLYLRRPDAVPPGRPKQVTPV